MSASVDNCSLVVIMCMVLHRPRLCYVLHILEILVVCIIYFVCRPVCVFLLPVAK